MRKGRDLEMKSTSARGNATTDRYSLSGISQALDRVAQECRRFRTNCAAVDPGTIGHDL
jgi:hypothetical protein